MKNIISLVGLAGSGKSTIASELEKISNFKYIDSDSEIINKYQLSINEIFEKFGEADFRQKEKEIIHEIISNNDFIILATGGGAFADSQTLETLLQKSFVMWLNCDTKTIAKRVSGDQSRPLLKSENNQEIIKTLNKLLQTRKIYYKKAHAEIDTTNKLVKNIASDVWQQFSKYKNGIS